MERRFRISKYHEINQHFELCYGPGFNKKLRPFENITDDSLNVGIVDNNHFNKRRLYLVDKDREVLNITIPDTGKLIEMRFPGKSAILILDDVIERDLLKRITKNVMEKDMDRRDHLHCSTVSKVNDAGWKAIWAPLQNSGHLLHVRLVADSTLRSNSDPNEEDIDRLFNVFKKEC